MNLRNKKTGKIIDSKELLTDEFIIDLFSKDSKYFDSKLDKFQEEWEDYEEPKEWWYIDYDGGISCGEFGILLGERGMKSIGNHFETREEAEKAVRKLESWKRLKDKGFRLSAVVDDFFCLDIFMKGEQYEALKDDLKIIFGGEE